MIRLLRMIGGELVLVVMSHRLARPHWDALTSAPELVAEATPGDVVVMLLHVGAWLASWWLLLGTGHDLLVAVLEARGLRRRGGRRVAPAWVQRIINQALGSLLVLGVMAGPAGAVTGGQVVDPPSMAQVVRPPVPLVEQPLSPTPADPDRPAADIEDGTVGDGPPSDADTADEASGEAVAGGEVAGGEVDTERPAAPDGDHVVAAGENLWVIARGQLSADGSAPDDRAVHAHWVQLIRENLPTLRSGDPDLIFPGERLRLPSLTPSATTAMAAEADDVAAMPSGAPTAPPEAAAEVGR